jgi:hypothetical protein
MTYFAFYTTQLFSYQFTFWEKLSTYHRRPIYRGK